MSSIRFSLFSAAALVAACGQFATAPPAPSERALTLADDASAAAAPAAATHAGATLLDATGAEIGSARLTADGTGRVHLVVQVRGVAPGRHGIHLHAVGACTLGGTPAFASAGGHYNPAGRQHGHANPDGHHAGDLPNVEVNGAGNGHLTVTLEQFALGALADADGTAIVLHQNEDDQLTNAGPLGPGNSGPRIACGVVQAR
jgi:Cu-Zn family superoxide dismutase